jgi:hypothetical protein
MNGKTTTVPRRAFLLRAGGALSATIATTAALAGSPANVAGVASVQQVEHELATLRAEQAIRELHRSLLHELESGGEVAMAGASALQGIRRLEDRTGFAAVMRVEPEAGTASARFACRAERALPLDASLPHAEMARLQGQGVAWYWEDGAYEALYRQRDGVWMLQALRWTS